MHIRHHELNSQNIFYTYYPLIPEVSVFKLSVLTAKYFQKGLFYFHEIRTSWIGETEYFVTFNMKDHVAKYL